MKIWLRLTLIFSVVQILIFTAVGVSVLGVVRSTVREMVENESREGGVEAGLL